MKKKKTAEEIKKEAEDKRIEEGYGSVDKDEQAAVDKKEILSNPG